METFMKEFGRQLREAVRSNPKYYTFGQRGVLDVLASYRRSMLRDEDYDLKSPMMVKTLLALRIKSSYKFVRKFIESHE